MVDVIDYMNKHLTPDEREQRDVTQGQREKKRQFINIMAKKNDALKKDKVRTCSEQTAGENNSSFVISILCCSKSVCPETLISICNQVL